MIFKRLESSQYSPYPGTKCKQTSASVDSNPICNYRRVSLGVSIQFEHDIAQLKKTENNEISLPPLLINALNHKEEHMQQGKQFTAKHMTCRIIFRYRNNLQESFLKIVFLN